MIYDTEEDEETIGTNIFHDILTNNSHDDVSGDSVPEDLNQTVLEPTELIMGVKFTDQRGAQWKVVIGD